MNGVVDGILLRRYGIGSRLPVISRVPHFMQNWAVACMDDLLAQQKALDLASAANRRDAVLDVVGGWARSVMPPIAWGLLIAGALAILALYSWRRYDSSIPDWARGIFGVKRTLRSRRDLRPKASRYSAAVPAPHRFR